MRTCDRIEDSQRSGFASILAIGVAGWSPVQGKELYDNTRLTATGMMCGLFLFRCAYLDKAGSRVE